MTHRLNDAPILDQLDGQYGKFLLMILRKYKPNGVTITQADIEALLADQNSGDPFVLFTHGHRDSVEFKAIRRSEGERVAEHHRRTDRDEEWEDVPWGG